MSDRAPMSMAEFEARGLDVLTKYRLKYLPLKGGGVDVGIFSIERNETQPEFAKYGLLMDFPPTALLVRERDRGELTEPELPEAGITLPFATDEQKAMYIAGQLLMRMAITEARREESG